MVYVVFQCHQFSNDIDLHYSSQGIHIWYKETIQSLAKLLRNFVFFPGFQSVLSYFQKKTGTLSFPENVCKRANACLSKKERLELSKKKISYCSNHYCFKHFNRNQVEMKLRYQCRPMEISTKLYCFQIMENTAMPEADLGLLQDPRWSAL